MKNLVFIFLIISPILAFNQNKKSFFGKRFYISSEILANYPLFFNWEKGAEIYDHDMNLKKDPLNYSFHLNAGVIVNRNLSFNLDFSKGYFDICSGSTLGNLYEKSIFEYAGEEKYARTETMQVESNSIMLNLELSSDRTPMPIGINHVFGFGISYSKLIDNNYNSKIYYLDNSDYNYYNNKKNSENYYDMNPSFLKAHLYNFAEQKPRKSFDISYGVINRIPLTKSILFKYGIKMILHLPLKSDSNQYKYEDFIYTRYEIDKAIINQMSLNIFHFNCGFTYLF